jgi:hypothetical protein
MFIRGYDLFQNKVFSDWERWNFLEIILGYMVEDLHVRALANDNNADEDNRAVTFSQAGRVRARQMQSLDLEKNILQAKGLRTAISVRIVHTKTKDDVVTYILRVEDVESGLVWIVTRRYNEFYGLYEELNEASHFLRDLEFPRKRLTLRLSVRVIEQRVTMLEQFIRRALHILTLNACIDSSASHGLRRIQNFLAVEKHVDCIHPPLVDDQRAIELLAYRFLNDFNSAACQQCVRFTSSVELEGMIESGEEGYRGLLTFMHDALAEVEQFVQQQHEQQLVQTLRSRRPEWTEDQQQKLVRQCIRRQVEAALYLPLRRSLVRLLLAALESKSQQLQRSISLLQRAKPSVFMIDPMVTKTKSFPKALKAFRRALLAHLPADQGQFLVEAAATISEVHTECKEMLRSSRRLSMTPKGGSSTSGMTEVASWPQLQPKQYNSTDQRSLSTIRDDARMVSIDDPTWAYDSEDNKQRGSFGQSHHSSRGSLSSSHTSRRSLTERVSSFLLADSYSSSDNHGGGHSSTGGRFSLNGNERRSSTTAAKPGLDEEELEISLGEESQRVSFSVSASAAVMMLNIQVDETTTGRTSSTGSNSMSASAQKISSYVPKREQATTILEKRALSNEKKQLSGNVMEPERRFGAPEGDAKDSVMQNCKNDEIEVTQSPSGADMDAKANSWQDSADSLKLESLTGVSVATTELNSTATSPLPPVPPPRPSTLQPVGIKLSRPSSSSALFDSDDEYSPTAAKDPLTLSNIATDTKPTRFNRGSVSFASDVNSNGSNPSASNRLSTRQLDRTSSRKADIVDPLLRPPNEASQQQRGRSSSAHVDSTIFAEVFDRYRSAYDALNDDSDLSEEENGVNAISADDFLPIFTFVVVHVQVPQMLLLKEFMVALIANEDAFGECGYYLATFEAALQHVNDLASQYDDLARSDGFFPDRQPSMGV